MALDGSLGGDCGFGVIRCRFGGGGYVEDGEGAFGEEADIGGENA